MLLRTAPLFVAFATSGLLACTLDFDAIGFTGSGGEGTAGAGSTANGTTGAAPTTCEPAGDCYPPAAAGWVGPGALVEGAACGSGRVPLFEGGDDATATPCPCEPVGSVCSNAFVSFFYDDECNGSTGGASTLIPVQDVCVQLGALAQSPASANIAAPPEPMTGVCQVQPGFVPELTYAEVLSLCGFEPQPSGCGKDSACVPPGTACIAAPDPAGVVPCPDDYPLLRARKSKATQSCPDCPALPALSCDGRVEMHEEATCNGAIEDVIVGSAQVTCEGFAPPPGDVYLEYVLDTPPSCAPAQAELATETWTVCCR